MFASLRARLLVWYTAILAAVICAGPFLWSAVTATKLNADLYNADNNPFFYNQPPTFDHVNYLFTQTTFPTFAWNTLWVGLLVVVTTLVLGLPAAYCIARLDLRWSTAMGIAIFFVYLIPPSLLFLSLSRLVVWLGLQDSTWSLVLIYPTITVPVSTWLLIGFLKALPKDVEEQAMIDGYGSQCGFCTPGIVMALTGHLEAGGSSARQALTGNLCRCTGYLQILESAAAVDVTAVPRIAETTGLLQSTRL